MVWQVEWLILWKMIVKMLTHIHMVVYTWWCWHIYKGGGVCRVEMGLGLDANSCGWHIGARVKKLEVKMS